MAHTIGVHVIGPRYGEAVVLHLPDDGLVVVDSFGARPDPRSPVADYLAATFPAADRLAAFALTHPHADHSFRAAALIGRYPPDEVWVYNPFPADESPRYFAALCRLKSRDAVEDALEMPAGTTHLELMRFRDGVAEGLRTGAIGGRVLRAGQSFRLAGGRVGFHFLTPSDRQQLLYNDAVRRTGAALFADGPSLSTAPPPQPDHNRASGAMLVEFGATRILLMADAECPLWDEWSADACGLGGPVHFLKVAHHGSANGCHDGVYRLTDPALTTAVITPFHYGRVNLPSGEGVDWIAPRVRDLYCTNGEVASATSGRRFSPLSPSAPPPLPLTWVADIAADRRLAGLLATSTPGPGPALPAQWLKDLRRSPGLWQVIRPDLRDVMPTSERVREYVVVARYDDAGNRLQLTAGTGAGRLTP